MRSGKMSVEPELEVKGMGPHKPEHLKDVDGVSAGSGKKKGKHRPHKEVLDEPENVEEDDFFGDDWFLSLILFKKRSDTRMPPEWTVS